MYVVAVLQNEISLPKLEGSGEGNVLVTLRLQQAKVAANIACLRPCTNLVPVDKVTLSTVPLSLRMTVLFGSILHPVAPSIFLGNASLRYLTKMDLAKMVTEPMKG